MKRLVIGLGSDERGDDAAGLEVARLLRHTEVVPTSNPLDLVDLPEGSEEVVIVDAMRSGDPPGTIRRFDLRNGPLPSGSFVSGHLLGLAEALELARALGRLPAQVVVFGIEVEDVDVGGGLSPRVREAVGAVVEEIDRA